MTFKKSNLFLILIVFAVQFVFSSCKEKVDLKLDLQKGEKFKLKMISKQKTKQTMFGKEMESDSDMEMGYLYEVLDSGKDHMVIKSTYDSIKFSMKSGVGDVEYDSSKKDQPKSPMTSAYSALLGSSFTMKVTPEGKVTELKGADEIISKMIESTETLEEPMKEQMAANFKKQFGKEQLKQQMENAMKIYPAKSVGVGDTWKKQVEMMIGFPVLIESRYKLTKITDDSILLDVDSVLKENPKGEALKMGHVKAQYAITGTQKGTMQIGRKSGFITASEMDQDFKGEIKMEGGPGLPEGMSIPLEVHGKSIIKAY